ncbi:MAG: VUT family protein, partial [Caldivirga sp.]|uniref:VUT family protein n=1 Tax=Caldivirga sp. TaxID=2080243 RepID=UPI003D1419D6
MYPTLYFLAMAGVIYTIVATVMYASWRLGGDNVLFIATVASYLFLLTVSQYVASKIMSTGYAYITTGLTTYSATVATLDVLTLKYGRRIGYWTVRIASLLQLALWAINWLAIHASPAPFWNLQGAYEALLGTSARVAVASVTAFFT